MKKLPFLLLVLFILYCRTAHSQAICNPSGNLIIFSNYDGGVLNIDVDENISNLKIGITSYEMVTVNLTGAYLNNVTSVQFAGFTATSHHHCTNSPVITSIVGAPPGTDTIIFMPSSPIINSNGYSIIICNTSCDTSTNQGGCNTPDQVAAYFQQALGGVLRFHYTQYGCWNNVYKISNGGNCCAGAIPTSLQDFYLKNSPFQVIPYPTNGSIEIAYQIKFNEMIEMKIFDAFGQQVGICHLYDKISSIPFTGKTGVYLLTFTANGVSVSNKMVWLK